MDSILRWNTDSAQICRLIASKRSKIKVVLKTRNEDALLRDWIEHHVAIFGPNGVVVFDNMSNAPATYGVYKAYAGKIQVFQYDSMHNRIHYANEYGELYESIRQSADYYIFLDTDEFLCWHSDDNRVTVDHRLVENVLSSGQVVIPGIWIENVPFERHVFMYTFRQNRIHSGIRGGKPMISSRVILEGCSNHNIQLDRSLFQSCSTANLLVLHMKNLSAEQRIKVNLLKLQSYNLRTRELEPLGLSGGHFTLEAVLKLRIGECVTLSRAASNYINQIQSFAAGGLKELRVVGATHLVDDRLVFSDPADESMIMRFLRDPNETFLKAFARGR